MHAHMSLASRHQRRGEAGVVVMHSGSVAGTTVQTQEQQHKHLSRLRVNWNTAGAGSIRHPIASCAWQGPSVLQKDTFVNLHARAGTQVGRAQSWLVIIGHVRNCSIAERVVKDLRMHWSSIMSINIGMHTCRCSSPAAV